MNLKVIRNTTALAFAILFIGVLYRSETLATEVGGASGKVSQSETPIFARVGDRVVTVREFDLAYGEAKRKKFYHGKPPEGEEEALKREIAQMLIDRALLLIEAKRLNLKPNAERVNQKIAQFDQINSDKEDWKVVRTRGGLQNLKMTYEHSDISMQLEERVRNVRPPNNKQLRAYYNANLDKFTEPEQVRVSVILIKVDPSEPDFDKARKKAEEIIVKLREGGDFAELAALHSGDIETVNQGGDMGYLHGGMLGGLASEVVSKLKPGEISEPTGMMEGFAIFKLTERNNPKLKSFDQVKERAKELYLVDEGTRAWDGLIARLRKKIPAKVDESRYAASENPSISEGVTPSVNVK